jgi:hypothetical protein
LELAKSYHKACKTTTKWICNGCHEGLTGWMRFATLEGLKTVNYLNKDPHWHFHPLNRPQAAFPAAAKASILPGFG